MSRGDVGGQAVIEGVMMRGSEGVATAVRKEDGEIVVRFEDTEPFSKRYPKLNIPLLRGVFAFIDSMKIGINSLNYSASLFEDVEEEPTKLEKWLDEKFKGKTNDILIMITMIISFALSIGIFVGIPTVIANLFKHITESTIVLNLIEAILRILILILYMWLIAFMKDIYRVFQYHGAEHKTIFCYENGEELTVENVKKQSRLHPRCGTNFLFLIMFISIIVMAFTGWGIFWHRLLLRIVLIPVISGISYEIIKWLGRSDNKLAKIIAAPGLKLQYLTTREPDDSQIEVAIESLMAAEGIEKKMTIQELINLGVETLDGIDTARLDSQLLLCKVLNKDKIFLLTNKDEKIDIEYKHEYEDLLEKRKNKMPIKYILGECDFMGLDFNVQEGVLIPRSDTEVLVEEVLKLIPEDSDMKVCDLCAGTGAIGISLAHYRHNISVDLIDYYDIPEEVSKSNIEKNNLQDRVSFIKSNLLEEAINLNKKYNILVSNPPYIKTEEINELMEDVKDYEPKTALDGGNDGLDFYKKIINQSKEVLLESGYLAFEIGYDQGEEVSELMKANNYIDVKVYKDLASLDRVVIGKFIP